MRLSRTAGVAVVLAVAGQIAAVGPSLASHEPPRLGLTPVDHAGPYFELAMEAGEARVLQVELANFGHDEATARTYAADAYPVTNGGFGAELFGEQQSGPTLWLDYDSRELTLEPGDALVVAFTVSVPDYTAAGEYLTSLVVENADPFRRSGEGDIQVDQVTRSAIAVAIDVQGPRRPSLAVEDVRHELAKDASVVTFTVNNTGNVHLRPSGKFVLRDAEGATLASASLVMGAIYAGMGTTLEAPLAARLAPGDYCAQLTLEDAATGAAVATDCRSFTVEPPVDERSAHGGGPWQAIPVLQPVIDAAAEAPPVASLAALAALALVASGIVLARRRLASRTRATAPTSQPD